jgi:hypothetical protein
MACLDKSSLPTQTPASLNITNELVKVDAGNDESTEATKLKPG